MSRNAEPEYVDVSRNVIRSNAVKGAIEQSARQELDELRETYDETLQETKILPKLIKKHRIRATRLLEDMKSSISARLLKIAGWIMFRVFSKILTTVQFNKSQIEVLRKVRSSNRNPVIYLPVHRSHLDYILISFVLYMNNIKPPLVAAGNNLYIPFFGNLLRGLGAFFIRRKMDPQEGQKDHVYRAVLEQYMTENLKSGESLEFFLEGGRSRSGKIILPKTGLLSVIVNCVIENKISDVSIVPVGVSYDKLIDGNFTDEQLGKSKTPENFSVASKSIWTALHRNYGSVRVDFCQPFSLREYLRKVSDSIYSGNSVGRLKNHSSSFPTIGGKVPEPNWKCSPQQPCVACSAKAPGLRSIPSNASLYGLDCIVESEKRIIIQDLGEHVVHDASQASALMSTQLLAFLLLYKFPKGATMRTLVPAMNWLRDEVVSRKRDVGFSGEMADVIRYAYSLLGRDLVSTEVIQMNRTSMSVPPPTSPPASPANSVSSGHRDVAEDSNRFRKIVVLKPATKLSYILELQYYSNAVVSAFALDSIVGQLTFLFLLFIRNFFSTSFLLFVLGLVTVLCQYKFNDLSSYLTMQPTQYSSFWKLVLMRSKTTSGTTIL